MKTLGIHNLGMFDSGRPCVLESASTSNVSLKQDHPQNSCPEIHLQSRAVETTPPTYRGLRIESGCVCANAVHCLGPHAMGQTLGYLGLVLEAWASAQGF